MTVCIGILCEGGNAAVLAADEMVTFGPPMSLQTEPPGLKKIVQITDSIALCYAGSVPDGEDIIGKVQRTVAGASRPTVEFVAEQVRAAYEQLKQRRVEETILRPWLGANFQQFQELIVKASASQILAQVMGMVSQHNMQTDMLVAGSDDSGHHLFIVTHPAIMFHMNTMGYATIGSGAMHAGISLSLNKHTASDTLERALYRVYEAKKAAEVSPGVGRLTDIAVIRDGKFAFVTAKTLEALAKVHKEHPDLASDEQKGITESLT